VWDRLVPECVCVCVCVCAFMNCANIYNNMLILGLFCMCNVCRPTGKVGNYNWPYGYLYLKVPNCILLLRRASTIVSVSCLWIMFLHLNLITSIAHLAQK
jgi:hypothetical protein